MLQPSHGCLVERHGVLHEAFEVGPGKLNRRRPEDALLVVLRSPQLEAVDDAALDRYGTPFPAPHSDSRQARELVFDRPDGRPPASRPRVRLTKAVRL